MIISHKQGWLYATVVGTLLSVYASIRTKPAQSWYQPVRSLLGERCHTEVSRTARLRDGSMVGNHATDTGYRLFESCPGEGTHHTCARRTNPLQT